MWSFVTLWVCRHLRTLNREFTRVEREITWIHECASCHNCYKKSRKEWNICIMCDGGGRAQGCGKEKAAARSSFLGFPVMGVMRVRRSEICSLRAHWPVRLSHSTVQYTITYIATTVPTDKATSYTSTFLNGI